MASDGDTFPARCTFRYRPRNASRTPRSSPKEEFIVESTPFDFDMTTTARDVVDELFELLLEEDHTPEVPLHRMGLYFVPAASTRKATNQGVKEGDLYEIELDSVLAEVDLLIQEMATEPFLTFMMAKSQNIAANSSSSQSPLRVPPGMQVKQHPPASSTSNSKYPPSGKYPYPPASSSEKSRHVESDEGEDDNGDEDDEDPEPDMGSPSAALRVERGGDEDNNSSATPGALTRGMSYGSPSDFGFSAMKNRSSPYGSRRQSEVVGNDDDDDEDDIPELTADDLSIEDIEAAKKRLEKRVRTIKDARKVIDGRRHWTKDLKVGPTEKRLIQLRKEEEKELANYVTLLEESAAKNKIRLDVGREEVARGEQHLDTLRVAIEAKGPVEKKRNLLHQEVSNLKSQLAASSEKEKVLQERVADQQVRLKETVRTLSQSPYRASGSGVTGTGSMMTNGLHHSSPSKTEDLRVAEMNRDSNSIGNSKVDAISSPSSYADPVTMSNSGPVADSTRGNSSRDLGVGSSSLSAAFKRNNVELEVGRQSSPPGGVQQTGALRHSYYEAQGDGNQNTISKRSSVNPFITATGEPPQALSVSELWGGGSRALSSSQPRGGDEVTISAHHENNNSAPPIVLGTGVTTAPTTQPPLPTPPEQPLSMNVEELLSPQLRGEVQRMLQGDRGGGSSKKKTGGPALQRGGEEGRDRKDNSYYLNQTDNNYFQQQHPSSPYLGRGRTGTQLGAREDSGLAAGSSPMASDPRMKTLANDISAFLETDGSDLATRRQLLSKVQQARRSMEGQQ